MYSLSVFPLSARLFNPNIGPEVRIRPQICLDSKWSENMFL